jgi:D-alanyl-D-alanine endopeptidase (penicillin-binding protein 7)
LVSIKKLLYGGFICLLTAFSLMLPAEASTSKPVGVKKKPHASAKANTRSSAKAVAAKRGQQQLVVRGGKRVAVRHAIARVRFEPAKPSFGQLAGLHDVADSLELKSSVALVVDQDTNEVLFSKNAQAVLPIASLTKLMTAVVVAEARQPLDEVLSVTQDDVDTEKNSRSRLKVGTQLTREDMLHLALMSSENRAAHALGRNYPGGIDAFVKAMNLRAIGLGMTTTRYVEPTGLSSQNRSSAKDLSTLAKAALDYPIIRQMTTSPSYAVDVGSRQVQFVNTNRLIRNPDWEIGLQKTGYITEAGRCMLMQTRLAGRQLIMVFLDSAGKYSRLGDAERVRRWIEEGSAPAPVPVKEAAESPKLTS